MHIASLYIYPLKGGRAVPLQRSRFSSSGLEHDRRWMAVTLCGDDAAASSGGAEARFVTQRQLPMLATVIAEVVVADAAAGGGTALRLSSAAAAEAAPPPPPPLLAPLLRAADGARQLRSRIWGDEVVAVDQGDAAAAWLTAALQPPGGGGESLRLVAFDDSVSRRPVDPAYAAAAGAVETAFSDGYPVLLTSTASLRALNAAIVARDAAEPPLPMSRFRPNIVVDVGGGGGGSAGAAEEELLPPWAEDSWRRFALLDGGGALAAAGLGVKRCSRCRVTTTDQLSGAQGTLASEPLRTLRALQRSDAQQKGVYFGMNVCLAGGAGELRVGDALRVDEVGPVPPL